MNHNSGCKLSNRSYLSFWERLSQIWLSKWTLILLLMFLKVYLFKRSLASSVKQLSSQTASACSVLDNYMTDLETFPTKLSNLGNQFISFGLNQMNSERIRIIKLILTMVEYLIIFFVDVLFGTFTCLLGAALNGTVDFALDATDEVIVLVNQTIVGLAGDIQSGLDGLSIVINGLVTAFDAVKSFFSGDDNNDSTKYINQVNLTISALKLIQIPSTVTDNINSLKSDIPEFYPNSTTNFIKSNFDTLKNRIVLNNITTSVSDLPVISIQRISLCPPTSTFDSIYSDIGNGIHRTASLIMIILIVLAILAMVPVSILETLKWRKEQRMILDLAHEESTTGLNSVVYKYSNIFIYYLSKMSSNTLFLWFMSYITSPFAIIILWIGLGSIITVALQYALLRVTLLPMSSISRLFSGIEQTFKIDFEMAANNWTSISNKYISNEESTINEEMFGWVQNATSTVNDTVTRISSDINSGLNFLNGTILYKPFLTVVYCVIGRKLENIESGLEWIHDNAEISLPRIPNNFILDSVSDTNSTLSNALGKSSQGIKSIVESIESYYKSQLKIELCIAIIIISIWLSQVIIAAIILILRLLLNYWNKKNSNNSIERLPRFFISTPKPLTEKEKEYVPASWRFHL